MATFLVLGANGNTGSELSRLLDGAGHTVRRATHRDAGPGQVHVDLVKGTGIEAAVEGADGAFLLAPPGHVNQDALLVPVIDAARSAGVPRVVLMTAMGADADPDGPFRRAERHLEASGLAWNVIRPNWFMQNFHTFWRQGIVDAGAIRVPAGHAKGSFVDARDIAAVAASLLQRADLAHRSFDVTGAEALDHDEVAASLTTTLGRPIHYEDVSPDAMRGGLLAAGLPPAYAEMLLAILAMFREGHSARVTDAVTTITGRAPRRFAEYARDYRNSYA